MCFLGVAYYVRLTRTNALFAFVNEMRNMLEPALQFPSNRKLGPLMDEPDGSDLEGFDAPNTAIPEGDVSSARTVSEL